MSTHTILRAAAFAASVAIACCAAAAAERQKPAGAEAAANASPSRVGEAAVRAGQGGQPCFTIGDKEEQRYGAPQFQAVSVTEAGSRPLKTVWAMEMPGERGFPLMFSMCLPYAGRVSSLPQRPAEDLQAGRVYEVRLAVRPGGAPGQPRSYAASFCLLRQADGALAVRVLTPSSRAAATCAHRQ